MRVTQQDIARIASVSQATVSRVLAGDEKVESTIRDRVLDAITENNYQPDVRARSLRQKRTRLIGLVLNRPAGGLGDDPFFSNFIAAILDALSGRPYHLCMDMASSAVGQTAIYDEMLRTRRVDGVILVESEVTDRRIARLQEEGFPFVLVGNPLDATQIHSVDNDNAKAAEMATRHLQANGYERIGFLGARRGVTVSDDRMAGYRSAVAEPLFWHADFGPNAAREVAREALRRDKPDAIVVLDDFMAMGVVAAAREQGLRIPLDLGLVSFNDTNLCQLVEGGLSSVSLRVPEMVDLAVDRLLAIIEGRPFSGTRRTLIPCELRARRSSQREVAA